MTGIEPTRRTKRPGRIRARLGMLAIVVAALAVFSSCLPAPPGDFYAAPDPLPRGAPGKIIWVQPATAAGPGLTSLRVMYHSRDAQNRDVAVTGTVSYPNGPAPAGGWPVVSFGHGTSGMASQCAPSRGGATGSFFGVQGIAVASDYVGLGPLGQRHPYLSGESEGHSMIDIVRAVRQIPQAHASKRWVSIGVSQGGHAALFAGELTRSYAPELDLVGVVAAAPGSGLLDTYPGDTQLLVDTITIMSLYGNAVDHPQIHPEDYVTPALAAKASVLDTGCVAEIGLTIAGIPSDQLFVRNPRTTWPATAVAAANNPGNVRTAAPILLVQGTADVVVLPQRTAVLRDQLCRVRDSVGQITVPGGTHDTALGIARPQIATWLNERLAGVPAVSTCA